MLIHDIASIFGISNELIRHYEDKGIVFPNYRDNNGYREFRQFDFDNLLFCHKYKALGLSLKTISNSINSEPLSYLSNNLGQVDSLIKHNIRMSILSHEYLLTLLNDLQAGENNVGLFWFEVRSEFVFIIYTDNSKVNKDLILKEKETIKSWLNNMPFVEEVLLINCDNLKKGLINHSYRALSIDTKYLEALDIDLKKTKPLPSSLTLVTVLKTVDDNQISIEQLQSLYQEALNKGYLPEGILAAKLLACCKRGTTNIRYYKVSLPVKKES